MRILHIVDQISQDQGGGAPVVAYNLAREQAKLGHGVAIYTSDHNADKLRALKGVKLVKYHSYFALFGVLYVPLGLLFANYNYDIVHLHNYRTVANLLAAIRGRNIVLQAHGNSSPLVSKLKPIYDVVCHTFIFNRAKRYIADAEAEIEQYRAEGNVDGRVVVIPVGINMREYTHLPKRTGKNYRQILFMGRLHEAKGCDLLIRAVAMLDGDIRLNIAGTDYGQETELRTLVKRLGMCHRIKFIGSLTGKTKMNELINADVFVMPSRYEMWGIAFMEALACGVPVIMSNKCEASKILPVECGTVVSLNELEIANAIKFMLDSNYMDKHRTYRHKWAAQYSWDKIAKRTIGVYEEVLNE